MTVHMENIRFPFLSELCFNLMLPRVFKRVRPEHLEK